MSYNRFRELIQELRKIQKELFKEFPDRFFTLALWGLDKQDDSFEFYVDVGIDLRTGKLTSDSPNLRKILE